jgi:cytochrome bd-type quinol oxidase subunit 1
MFSMAMWMAALVAPVQIFAGDQHGLNTLEYQPAKIAAMEGHWETRRGAPLILFGWPDMAEERTRFAVEVPKLGSLILTHSWDGEVKGLKAWPPSERPNSLIVFWSFRIMVGIGVLMLLKIPKFGDLLLKREIGGFTRTLGSLLRNGVPILNALGIAGEGTGQSVHRLSQGAGLGQSPLSAFVVRVRRHLGRRWDKPAAGASQ